MKLAKLALAVLLGAAAITALTSDSYGSESPDLVRNKPISQSLEILQPKEGQNITGARTEIKSVLSIGDGIRPDSLRLTLNGNNVSSPLDEKECKDNACLWTAEVAEAEGLRAGPNELVLFARGFDNSIKIARAEFGYYPGLRAGQNQPNWLAPSVGLSLNRGGVQPWVKLTTGWPANVQDNLDPAQYSLPYRDMTFPTAADTPCDKRYQVVALNRVNPAQEDYYGCFDDAASLKTQFAAFTKGAEIVLVGTTVNNNADSGLDTTSIGGTDYSSYSAAWQPQGYAAIGVSGAAPGSAYESYYLASDIGKAYQTNPFANGLLAKDQNGNYNFHAGGIMQFEVYPNAPGGESAVFISSATPTTNKVLGWSPPAGSANGLWLLTLDRVTLYPIDSSYQNPCQINGGQCGQFFPTGSSDPNVAAEAATDLGRALLETTDRQLMVLTTVGQPFQTGTNGNGYSGAVELVGGSGFTFPSLTSSTSTYTLIAPGLRSHNSFLPLPWLTPFSHGVVNSSSAFSQQGQTGFVRGVMAPDNNGLYFPSVVSQEDGKMNGDGATALSINYDFYTISTYSPIDWALTDTAGHMAAYHWASQKFLANHYGSSGDPLGADLRYWFHSPTRASDIGAHNTDFECPNTTTNSPCVYPGDGLGFNAQDLADVDAELYKELTALHDTDLYLGQNGIGGLIQQNYGGGGGLADQVIAATYEILKDQAMPVQSNTGVNVNSYDWMNLLAGVASIGAAALGPLDLPVAAAAVGVASGALWTGSAFGPWAANDPITPPNYESGFDTTLGQMEENAETYAGNLVLSYSSSLDSIYSDWGKLSATGAKTADSATGWYFDSNVASLAFSGNLIAGAKRSLYTQLLPMFYSLDAYYAQPVSSIAKLGMFQSYYRAGDYFENSCTASYPSTVVSDTHAYRVFPAPGIPGKTDMFVLGGRINNQGTPQVSESYPSDSLLSILFGNDSGDLNIPQDLIDGAMAVGTRSGPNQGTYYNISQCYNPGCHDFSETINDSSCVNP